MASYRLQTFISAFQSSVKLMLVILLSALSFAASAERLKDISSVAGVRVNQLVGYGLVVGLTGTGDKGGFTSQTFKNMLGQFGVDIACRC